MVVDISLQCFRAYTAAPPSPLHWARGLSKDIVLRWARQGSRLRLALCVCSQAPVQVNGFVTMQWSVARMSQLHPINSLPLSLSGGQRSTAALLAPISCCTRWAPRNTLQRAFHSKATQIMQLQRGKRQLNQCDCMDESYSHFCLVQMAMDGAHH